MIPNVMRFPVRFTFAYIGLLSLAGSVAAQGTAFSATGSGHFTLAGGLRTFAFSAIKHEDGTVSGNAQLNNRATNIKTHVEVDCLRVEGNRAVIGGVVTKSTDTSREGTRVIFAVIDNGEGNDDPPDQISFLGLLPDGTPADLCLTFDFSLFPMATVERGNVQVRSN